MQSLEEEGSVPMLESSFLLKKSQGTTCGEDGVPQETIHNDPAVCNKLRGSALRGSTFLMAVYHEQKRNRQAASIRSSRDSIGSRGSFTGRAPSIRSNFLAHIQTSFFDDAKSLAEGTIPQSIVLALVIGTLCGVFAFVYYTLLEIILEFCWQQIPRCT